MKTELASANDIIRELMHRKLKVNITEVDRAPFVLLNKC